MQNFDQLNNADPEAVAKACFALMDRLQHFSPAIQVHALAATFVTVTDSRKVPAQMAFTTTKNLMNGKEGLRAEFAALKDYVKYELKPS